MHVCRDAAPEQRVNRREGKVKLWTLLRQMNLHHHRHRRRGNTRHFSSQGEVVSWPLVSLDAAVSSPRCTRLQMSCPSQYCPTGLLLRLLFPCRVLAAACPVVVVAFEMLCRVTPHEPPALVDVVVYSVSINILVHVDRGDAVVSPVNDIYADWEDVVVYSVSINIFVHVDPGDAVVTQTGSEDVVVYPFWAVVCRRIAVQDETVQRELQVVEVVCLSPSRRRRRRRQRPASLSPLRAPMTHARCRWQH